MDKKQLKHIIDSLPDYDETREDSLLSMTGQLYSAQMLPSMLVHFLYSLPFIAGAIFCGIKFFRTDQMQLQIMYATIFACCIQFMIFSKNKYWQMLHRHNINREIKRLELRIAELNDAVKNSST
jgi:uncharacterized membrane protein YciS (DUF1049 family)